MRKIGFLLTGVLFLACRGVPVSVLTEPPERTVVLAPAPALELSPAPELALAPALEFAPAPVVTPILAVAAAPAPELSGGPVIQLVQDSGEPEPVAYSTGDAGPAGGLVFYPVLRSSAVPPTDVQDYKVGDTGPAGGIIFYVRPNAGDGWKYLEAAPDSTEVTARWSISQTIPTEAINGSRGIGMGKPNTEYIMEQAMELGGGYGWAAQLCDELEVNGFDDWFLPSRDELNVMWGVLHRRGLGGFKNESYWSSTPVNNEGTRIWLIEFANGDHSAGSSGGNYYNGYRLRAIRQF
jgi:hypothetical protein